MLPDPRHEHCVAIRHVFFRRDLCAPPLAGMRGLLAPFTKQRAEVIPDWHEWGHRLIEAIRRRCAERGWDSISEPWPWYEPDFRLHADVDGDLVIIFAVVPYSFDQGGFVALCRAPTEPEPPEEKARAFLDVIRDALTGELDACDLAESDHENFMSMMAAYRGR